MKKIFIIIFLLPVLLAFSPIPTPNEKGISAYDAGKYGDALSEFAKAAKDNPDRPEARINMGDALYKKGEYDQAAKEYSEAARLDPKMPEAWYNMGDAYYRMGAYDRALDAFRKADSLKKDADTQHNIEVTMEKVKKERQDKGGGQGLGASGQRQKQGAGASNQQGKTGGRSAQGQKARKQAGQGQNGQERDGQAARVQGGPGGLSDGDVSSMLARQREQERRLRGYFRPGQEGPLSGRENEIDQMLRGMGVPAPFARAAKPGAPYVEKDW